MPKTPFDRDGLVAYLESNGGSEDFIFHKDVAPDMGAARDFAEGIRGLIGDDNHDISVVQSFNKVTVSLEPVAHK